MQKLCVEHIEALQLALAASLSPRGPRGAKARGNARGAGVAGAPGGVRARVPLRRGGGHTVRLFPLDY